MSSSSVEKVPVHILKLSMKEKRDFLASFDHVFADIDGVAWNVFSNISDAAEGFKVLENDGKKLTFITNNSVRSTEQCSKRFEAFGLDVQADTIWHPAKSVTKYLISINFKGAIYVIATDFFKNTLRDAGFKVIDSNHGKVDDFKDFARKIFEREPVSAVVLDADFNLSAVKLTMAQLYLKNPECQFIIGATDMMLPIYEDNMILGPGQFSKILCESTGRKPITLGKPGRELADLLKQEFKIKEPKRALMIGDMLEQDIGFGSKCGFQTLAVLSGGTKVADLFRERNVDFIPDFYADSMADFVAFINDLEN